MIIRFPYYIIKGLELKKLISYWEHLSRQLAYLLWRGWSFIQSSHHSAGCGGGGGEGKRNVAGGEDLKKLRSGGGGEGKRNVAGGGDLKKLRSRGGGEGKRNAAGGRDLKKFRVGGGGEVKRNAAGGGGEVKRKADRDLPECISSDHESAMARNGWEKSGKMNSRKNATRFIFYSFFVMFDKYEDVTNISNNL